MVPPLSNDAGALRWVIMQDNTPSEPPLTPPDYDEFTSDVSEGPGTISTFAGGVSGFGSRLWWVGGLGGTAFSLVATQRVSPADAGLNPGDRGAFLGRIARLDIRQSASSATAQAVSPDGGTQEEQNARSKTVRERM